MTNDLTYRVVFRVALAVERGGAREGPQAERRPKLGRVLQVLQNDAL